ncbi:gluconate 2-dehydrogenase subunit 3 family protein [Halobacterium salinarum]|uniref:gluconate 2-dehydrogenase subunit 3 family protein n=1 Tax=Halobacterium salinarum TaxID=2242 RepID=UPI00255788F7|nr:gluconate 2-dehydrogenase subunit 3 family protein [Halobacterium salinarum]MDL0121741.1 gluconate 2-dehydrogenase subunit 3 family protein [Halobacterium salinarum]MDL0134373.1 gluconate 2-dehydrogenase subunit 3 family protein [Halobacterium salinarum]
MELTRRDVLAALAAGGVAAGAGVTLSNDSGGPLIDDHVGDTLVAVAAVVYPSQLDGVESFVREYSGARVREHRSYASGVADAVDALDAYCQSWADADFAALDPERADDLLSGFGVDTADPDPDGSDRERVRYYLVNELLYALFTTPTGGDLVGIENPPGHPGGTASYQRGPQ